MGVQHSNGRAFCGRTGALPVRHNSLSMSCLPRNHAWLRSCPYEWHAPDDHSHCPSPSRRRDCRCALREIRVTHGLRNRRPVSSIERDRAGQIDSDHEGRYRERVHRRRGAGCRGPNEQPARIRCGRPPGDGDRFLGTRDRFLSRVRGWSRGRIRDRGRWIDIDDAIDSIPAVPPGDGGSGHL